MVMVVFNSYQLQDFIKSGLGANGAGRVRFFVINLMVLQQYWFVFALLIYGIVQFLLKRNFKIKHSLYAVNKENRIILSEYYNYYILFFSLLIASIYISSMYLIPLISFMILFFYSYNTCRKNLNVLYHKVVDIFCN